MQEAGVVAAKWQSTRRATSSSAEPVNLIPAYAISTACAIVPPVPSIPSCCSLQFSSRFQGVGLISSEIFETLDVAAIATARMCRLVETHVQGKKQSVFCFTVSMHSVRWDLPHRLFSLTPCLYVSTVDDNENHHTRSL